MSLRDYKSIKVCDLVKYNSNSRTHSDEQIAKIVRSINEFGFTNPLLIDENNMIIAGHGRLEAALSIGILELPCIVLPHLTDAQKAALVIADNKIALDAGWDNEMLVSQFNYLKEFDFDITLTGFDLEELIDIFPDDESEVFCEEDDCPDVPEEPICKPGDVWILGDHRIVCGDSTSIDAVDKLMNGSKADMVFTDPPYGMSAVSKSGVLSKTYKTDIMNDDSVNVAKDAYRISVSMNIELMIFWGANYYSSCLPDATCWLVWDKNNGQSDQMDCELAWTNLKGVTRQYTQSSEKIHRVHPTQKPVSLAEWCFIRWPANNILDLFGGSGSTLIACEKLKRKCFMMELDPKYCDVIIKRYENYTGKKAVLEA